MAWRNSEIRINKVPVEIVDPTKNLIRAAIEKLRQSGEKIDCVGRKSVYMKIETPEGVRLYQILTNYGEEIVSGNEAGITSGLFISQQNLYDPEDKYGDAHYIQIPCDPATVTQEEIFIIRDVLPESLNEAAKDIKAGKLISEKEYQKLKGGAASIGKISK